jgi:hypothetical protein
LQWGAGSDCIIRRSSARSLLEQRLDQHLKNNGMRSAAHRAYAVEIGRKIIAKDAAMANTRAAGDLDDFFKICPGAAKIEALTLACGGRRPWRSYNLAPGA